MNRYSAIRVVYNMSQKKTIKDIDVTGKTVLLRVDFNVEFRPDTTDISDDGRIRASLPTVRYLVERGCRIVVCSHLGRPKGKVVEDLRMAPVSRRLSKLVGKPVIQASDSIGLEIHQAVKRLQAGELLMLENLRFHPGEESNTPAHAEELASFADVFVNDGFGAAHRAHASTAGVARFLPAVAGLLMERELAMLGQVMESPRRPFALVMGGAKVSDKLGVLENLADKVDILIVGGGMAATFLRAQGLDVGESPVEDGRTEATGRLVDLAGEWGLDLLLPVDVVVADAFRADANQRTVDVNMIPPGWRIMDVGPRSTALFEEALSTAKTVFWNGPLGVFEWASFAEGTRRIANTITGLSDATTLIGGGSTAAAVSILCLRDRMTHVSTGGGATLEFLEGKELPGVAALLDRE